MNATIYICIPVFNRIEYTLKCIDSIKKQKYPHYKIIICDDGSTDGTSEILGKNHPEVIVLKGTGSLWWTGGTNMCVEHALSIGKEGDYIFTLNNDTEVLENTLLNMLELEKKVPNALIGSLNVFHKDPDKIEPSAFVRKNKLFLKKYATRLHRLGDTVPKNIEYTEAHSFAGKGVLIPFAVFEKIGIYNAEMLPHYHADSEFTARATNNGFTLLYCYTAKVLSHQDLTGTGTQSNSFSEFIKSFKSLKSALHYKSLKNRAKLLYGKNYRVYLYHQLSRIVLGYFRRVLKGV